MNSFISGLHLLRARELLVVGTGLAAELASWGIFVIAKEKIGNNNRVWEASSYVKKHDDKYNLVLSLRDAHGKYREASITKSFANFIDTNGLVAQNLVINEVTKIYNSLSSEKKDK
ncbi:Signal peptidase complex subunit 2 [Operophtera brumata]|uniref:Signal peptidase complex subunit 2 n=1 Tax=Operophtera brumata TaxID=104452 RepID=A0A0L7K9E6_OPEBR|nr:Signal peptidase complex subunit 2 [Operophtera brumata]